MPGVGRIVLPTPARPVVTLVVPAWRKVALLRRTLRAIAEHVPADVGAETMVVVNGRDERVEGLLDEHVEGAWVHRSPVNLGFAGACNLAASFSRARYLVLLNDDVEVLPGWLEALVEAAEARPDAGAVGARVLHPDGVLQEAGCVVWSDGSTAQVGKDAVDAGARYLARRSVDYSSACSVLVRRVAWNRVGGMDAAYFPGYYEDVDLAFRLRADGWATLYEPGARVVHEESASLDAEYKAFVVARNRERFRERWEGELAGREPRSVRPEVIARAVERARGLPQRLLVVGDPEALGRARLATLAEGLRAARFGVWVLDPAGPPSVDVGLALGVSGIETVDVGVVEHLSSASVLYDAIALRTGDAAATEDVAHAVARQQPHAALLDVDDLLAADQPAERLATARRAAAVR